MGGRGIKMASLGLFSCVSRVLNVSKDIPRYLSCMHRFPLNINLHCGRLLMQRFVYFTTRHCSMYSPYTPCLPPSNFLSSIFCTLSCFPYCSSNLLLIPPPCFFLSDHEFYDHNPLQKSSNFTDDKPWIILYTSNKSLLIHLSSNDHNLNLASLHRGGASDVVSFL